MALNVSQELINLTRNSEDNTEITLQNNKEIESVLHDCHTSELNNASIKDDLSLEEVKNSSKNLDEESCSLDTQNTTQTNESIRHNTENELNNREATLKLEIQDNDGTILKDLTTYKSSRDSLSDVKNLSFEEDAQSISSNGYHSSDFEFITETEANLKDNSINFDESEYSKFKHKESIFDREDKSGPSDHYNTQKYKHCNRTELQNLPEQDTDSDNSMTLFEIKRLQMIKRHADDNVIEPGEGLSGLNDLQSDFFDKECREQMIERQVNDNVIDPGEGPSGLNDLQSDFFDKECREQMIEGQVNDNVLDPGEGPSGLNDLQSDYFDKEYRDNHVIPEEEGYLELFQNPMLPIADIIILENKSFGPSPMNIQYEGMGFENQLIWHNNELNSSAEEYEDEANENMQKILLMYPEDNRKPKRRF